MNLPPCFSHPTATDSRPNASLLILSLPHPTTVLYTPVFSSDTNSLKYSPPHLLLRPSPSGVRRRERGPDEEDRQHLRLEQEEGGGGRRGAKGQGQGRGEEGRLGQEAGGGGDEEGREGEGRRGRAQAEEDGLVVERRDDEGSLNKRQGGFGDTLQSQSASECSTFVTV